MLSNLESQVSNFQQGSIKTTIKQYLSMFAICAWNNFSYKTDRTKGIEYDSSQLAPVSSIKSVTVLLLTMGMTGNWEYLNAKKSHLNAGSKDTAIAFVDGAQHTINTCTKCEKYPSQFGNTLVTA